MALLPSPPPPRLPSRCPHEPLSCFPPSPFSSFSPKFFLCLPIGQLTMFFSARSFWLFFLYTCSLMPHLFCGAAQPFLGCNLLWNPLFTFRFRPSFPSSPQCFFPIVFGFKFVTSLFSRRPPVPAALSLFFPTVLPSTRPRSFFVSFPPLGFQSKLPSRYHGNRITPRPTLTSSQFFSP